jgi:hypothetical protein
MFISGVVMRYWIALCFFCVALSVKAEAVSVEEVGTLSAQDAGPRLAQSHPAMLYLYAKQLFERGDKDAAVTWFYIGQLRFRFHLLANPSLPQDGEPALMGALNATLGQTINGWAGGSPQHWSDAIQAALAWDALYPNAFTSKEQHAAQLETLRVGLAELQAYVVANAEVIRAQRIAQGLENR